MRIYIYIYMWCVHMRAYIFINYDFFHHHHHDDHLFARELLFFFCFFSFHVLYNLVYSIKVFYYKYLNN